jgi:hypothetical protein
MSFAHDLKEGDLVHISTKDAPYKIIEKRYGGDEPRFGPLWILTLEEIDTGGNKHNDVIQPDGTSMEYFRKLSPYVGAV